LHQLIKVIDNHLNEHFERHQQRQEKRNDEDYDDGVEEFLIDEVGLHKPIDEGYDLLILILILLFLRMTKTCIY
jgi:hypothetical protein